MGGKNWKQKIIDDYLNSSGQNVFVPAEFIAWLRDRPDHECYELFYGISDEAAAQHYREDMVRRWISGLRVVVRSDETTVRHIGAIRVSEYSVPALHSPVESRFRGGGGYVHTDPDDPAQMAEIVRQGAVALAAWIERYQGAANLLGVDCGPATELRVALSAAADMADPAPAREGAA